MGREKLTNQERAHLELDIQRNIPDKGRFKVGLNNKKNKINKLTAMRWEGEIN